MDKSSLSGRTVLITGASSGIGLATAQMAASRGARIIAHGRDVGRLEALVAELPGDGHEIAARNLDELDGLESWLDEIVRTVGPLSGYVHSAGLGYTEPLKLVRVSTLEKMYKVNVLSAILLTKAMRKPANHTAGASIVFLSSVAASRGRPGIVAYSGTKGALQSMTRALAMELIKDQIRVNCVAPAMIDTEMARGYQVQSPAAWEKEMAAHPMGLGQAEDVARMICFLLSEETRWVTGTHMPVDGGYTA